MRINRSGFAILGGTFDPVHIGHLRVAIESRELLGVDRVKLVPSFNPTHRDAPGAAASNRIDMLKLAIEGIDGLEIDEVECQPGGPSFTVDTLTYYRQTFGSECPMVLLMGADAFLTLSTWHDWHRIGELTNIAVIDRPGFMQDLIEPLASWMESRRVDKPHCLMKKPSGLCCHLHITQLDISASMIREKLRTQSNVEYLLSPQVIDYIRQHQLYNIGL